MEGKYRGTFSPCPSSSFPLCRGVRESGPPLTSGSGSSTPLAPPHGLMQISLQVWSRYLWDHFWDSSSFALSQAGVPTIPAIQSQLGTALPIAPTSLRALRNDDSPGLNQVSDSSGDCGGPTGRLLLPASPGQTDSRVRELRNKL